MAQNDQPEETNTSSKNEKSSQLSQHTRELGERLTTNQGVPINDNQNTLKAGERGPSLL